MGVANRRWVDGQIVPPVSDVVEPYTKGEEDAFGCGDLIETDGEFLCLLSRPKDLVTQTPEISDMSISVVDLDADGDLDVVVTGKFGGPVWFENRAR